jgi:hypothetical protein
LKDCIKDQHYENNNTVWKVVHSWLWDTWTDVDCSRTFTFPQLWMTHTSFWRSCRKVIGHVLLPLTVSVFFHACLFQCTVNVFMNFGNVYVHIKPWATSYIFIVHICEYIIQWFVIHFY